MNNPKLELSDVFEVYLHGTGQEVLWKLALEKEDEDLKKEISSKFEKYCKKYGLLKDQIAS